MNKPPVVVYTANGQIEAEMIRLLLESAGITAFTIQEAAGRTYGLTVGALGQVDILVSGSAAEDARAVIDDYERGKLEQPNSGNTILDDNDPHEDENI